MTPLVMILAGDVTHNDILRSIRYMLNVRESELIEILATAGHEVSAEEMSAYLKREEEPGYLPCPEEVLAKFLDGLVAANRGVDPERPARPTEIPVTHNVVLKKLRIAFELKDTDIIALIEKSGVKISKSELSAFFRSPEHRNYRECEDQFLRNFLKGLTP